MPSARVPVVKPSDDMLKHQTTFLAGIAREGVQEHGKPGGNRRLHKKQVFAMVLLPLPQCNTTAA